MKKCPFCDPEIISTQSIFENGNVRVIYNRSPVNTGQCMVVPKRHVTNIRELNQEELIDLITTVQLVSRRYQETMKLEGFNYGFNEGHYSGQRVDHFHFHIMPRVEGDKEKLSDYHLFHRKPETKITLSPDEMRPAVDEMKNLFL
jgi:diadenosine tetraphosphate (Ap4A) HIT family hydrolase